MTTGELVRKTRKKMGWTLKELSEKSEISLSFLSDVERGYRNLGPENAIKLSKILNIDSKFLLPEELVGALSEDSLLKTKAKKLTQKDIKDINDILKQAEQQLMNAEGLMFDGQPASPEAVQSLLDAMRLGMELAKQRNKEKYTPKKYRE